MRILEVYDYAIEQIESNHGKREHWKWGCSWIIKFSHLLNFGYHKYVIIFSIQTQNGCTCHMQEGKIWTTFHTF